MSWGNWFAVRCRSGAGRVLLIACVGLGGAAAAQTGPGATASRFNVPKPHVEDVYDISGQRVILRRALCRAPGQPDVAGDFYVLRDGDRNRIGRLAYSDGAQAILNRGRDFPVTRQYFERYVVRGEPFSDFTLNAALGLWRMLGMTFRLDGVQYRCEVQ